MRVSERLRAALATAESRAADFTQRLEKLNGNRASPEDFDRYAREADEITRLETLARANVEAIAHHRREIEKAVVDEAAADLDREAAAMDREAAQWARREVPRIVTLTNELAQALAALSDHRKKVEGLNARLRVAGKASVENGEDRARKTPGFTIPAQIERRDRWEFPGGRSPTVYRVNDKGEQVPTEAGAYKLTEDVTIEPERFVHPKLALSFVQTVALPGLRRDDTPLWPPRP